MDLEAQRIATEERLLREADSFGGFFDKFRGRVSPQLIGDEEWENIRKRICGLPVTIAAFPFGFELPLHESRPGADFGASVIGGSQTATFRTAESFEKKGKAKDADPSDVGIAWLLSETESEDSPLRRVAGRKMMLEYDIDLISPGAYPAPGIFLYPDELVLTGEGSEQKLQDLRIVVDAVASATGLNLKEAERRQVDRVYLAMSPGVSMRSIGSLASRGEEGIRLATTGFKKTTDIAEFLKRTDWPGQHSTAVSTVSRLEERGAFAYAAAHYDITEDGVGPKLGLSFFAQAREWIKGAESWLPLIESLREDQLAVPEKLSELVQWPSGSDAFQGKSGQFVLVRGIHHIKLTFVDDRVDQVKAYIFFLVFAWPLAG